MTDAETKAAESRLIERAHEVTRQALAGKLSQPVRVGQTSVYPIPGGGTAHITLVSENEARLEVVAPARAPFISATIGFERRWARLWRRVRSWFGG